MAAAALAAVASAAMILLCKDHQPLFVHIKIPFLQGCHRLRLSFFAHPFFLYYRPVFLSLPLLKRQI